METLDTSVDRMGDDEEEAVRSHGRDCFEGQVLMYVLGSV